MSGRRLFMDYAAQLVWIGANLVDRILLTYLLIKFWGVPQFESWSVVLSIASLISMFDFGMSLHFSNHITSLWERKRSPEFERTIGVANSLFAAAACLGLISVIVYLFWVATPDRQGLFLPVLFLSSAYALKIAVSGTLCLFRANQKYATLTAYVSAGEYARIFISIILCVMGYGIEAVAGFSAAMIILLQVILPVFHVVRNFDNGRTGFARVRAGELKQAISSSLPYFLQAMPTILLNAVPVFILGSLQSGIGAVATFVTVRTLTSLPRALIQQSSIVFGMDAGRLIFKQDFVGLERLVKWSSRFVCVSSGAVAGLIFAIWKPVLLLWTSGQLQGSLLVVGAGLLPLMFAANATLALNILVCAEKAGAAAIGRFVQVALSLVFYLALPIQDVVTGMLLALSLGEMFGFSPLVQRAVAMISPSQIIVNPISDFGFALCGFAIVAVPCGLLFSRDVGTTPITLIFSFMFALIVTCAVIGLLGFERDDRVKFVTAIRRRLQA
jgi:hypothetical protein